MRVPEHVHWRRFDSELVLVDLKHGQYYGLSEVAAEAFERLALGKGAAEVVTDLLELYEVSAAQLEGDVEQLVQTLVRHGLLV